MSNKQGKMINYRMRVTLIDGRQMIGQMLAFDKHMNLVLADTEEFRRIKRKQAKGTTGGTSTTASVEVEEKRTLGLTIVRGAHIVSLSVESPPPSDPSARLAKSTGTTTLPQGPGLARPAGRGAPVALSGPALGVGAAGPPAPGFPAPPGFPTGFPPGFPAGRGGPPPPFPGAIPPFAPQAGFPGAPGGGPFPPPFPGGPPPAGFQGGNRR